MERKGELPELLCPAGDMNALYAAILGGADAVYVGGRRFGARAFAKNFDIEELTHGLRYCHLHGAKLYVTVNTLLFDKEIEEALEYCRELYKIGVDAVICQDVGLISAIRGALPDFEIHASTQMSVNNTPGADTVHSLGVKRVVLARELKLSDVESVVKNSLAEVEVFLHGALCVCHSGQCLFSSLVGGRRGNRGECAQPCRLPYSEGYQLSLKDLSLAGHIPALIESGVASLKIEGRMKSAAYVYTVTKIYRRLLDERRAATGAERAELAEAFSRGGFTDGYLTGKFNGMTGIRSERDKEASRARAAEFTPGIIKKTVYARAEIALGKPATLTLFSKERSFTAIGAVPEPARSSPLTADAVKERLSKTGATMLSLPKENIELTLEGGLNLSPSEINALRREACAGFESCDREAPEIKMPSCEQIPTRKMTTALFLRPELAVAVGESIAKYFDTVFVPLFDRAALAGKYGVYIPPVVTDGELSSVRQRLAEAKNAGATHALITNISHITLAREAGLVGIGDFRLNVTNKYARREYMRLGVFESICSAELTLPKTRESGGAVTVYGRIPLMLTERCFMRRGVCSGKCPQDFSLTDRRGARFPIIREWGHRNLVLNSAVTFTADKPTEISALAARHFIFSTENEKEAAAVIAAYFEGGGYLPKDFRRIGSRL